MAENDKHKEILARFGQLMLDREELVRQLQDLDQRANRLKLQLFKLDLHEDKSDGE